MCIVLHRAHTSITVGFEEKWRKDGRKQVEIKLLVYTISLLHAIRRININYCINIYIQYYLHYTQFCMFNSYSYRACMS